MLSMLHVRAIWKPASPGILRSIIKEAGRAAPSGSRPEMPGAHVHRWHAG
jgi:hypothetical protein